MTLTAEERYARWRTTALIVEGGAMRGAWAAGVLGA